MHHRRSVKQHGTQITHGFDIRKLQTVAVPVVATDQLVMKHRLIERHFILRGKQ
ncbi:Uncharacterised protein [Vibrio cholerae]|nr:Uncharacterised protein [Vibrio cholerae]